MRASKLRSRSRHGFTLIELLVVIAIIAILAAILFPVFAQARAKARQASCTSNVKQLTLGFMMYVQDYDETFPYWNWGQSYSGASGANATPNHFESIWFSAIYPYVKNSQVFSCPSANDHGTIAQSNVFGWSSDYTKSGIVQAMWNAPINYGMNERLEDGSAFGAGGPVSLAAMDRPANTLVVADCATALTTGWIADVNNPNDPQHHFVLSRVAYPNLPADCWSNQDFCGAAQLDNGKNAAVSPHVDVFDATQSRHSAFTLVGFGDGHAKAVRSSQVTLDYLNGYVPH